MRPVAALLITVTLLPAADYHVSPLGDDLASGASGAPFRTIQRAAEAAHPGDTVWIRAGTYRETVTPPRSGTAASPIVFRAFGDGPAVISGADPVTGWTVESGAVWRAPMPRDWFSRAIPGNGVDLYDAAVGNQADQVFVDGRMVLSARWPDNPQGDPSAPPVAVTAAFVAKSRADNWTTGVVDDADAAPLSDAQVIGAEIRFQPSSDGWSWAFTGRVTSRNGGRLTFTTRSQHGRDGDWSVYAPDSRYILFNNRALLDRPGEWYHDKLAGTLSLWAPDGGSPEGRVEAKRRRFAFDLSDRSWITISGLRIFACTITTDRDCGGDHIGWDAAGNERFPWRNAANPAASHHIALEELDVLYPTHFTDLSGHFFMQWGQGSGLVLSGADHRVVGCVVRWSAGNGIGLHGLRHQAINNRILDSPYEPVDCAAINTTFGPRGSRDIRISGNTIRRTARSGMSLRNLACSVPASFAARVHGNEVVDWGMQDRDVGAFYAIGEESGSGGWIGGNWLRIDHNRMWCGLPRSGMVFGAYFDWARDAVLDRNVIWGVPKPLQITFATGGAGQPNNLIVAFNTLTTNDTVGGRGIGVGGDNLGSVIHRNIIKVAATPHAPSGTWWNNWPEYGGGAANNGNLVWGKSLSAVNWGDQPAAGDSYVQQAPFTVPDAVPLAGSAAVDAASALAPLVRNGTTITVPSDPVVGSLPDYGAVERGAAWTAGSTLPAEPVALTATSAGASQIQLAWQDAAVNETGYRIAWSAAGSTAWGRLLLPAGSTAATISGLTGGTSYLVSVEALGADGGSGAVFAAARTAAGNAAPQIGAIIAQPASLVLP